MMSDSFKRFNKARYRSSQSRDVMVTIALIIIFIIPLTPRPTLENSARVIAPAVALIIIIAASFYFLTQLTDFRRCGPGAPRTIPTLLLLASLFYAARVGFMGAEDEYEFAISRLLM